MKKTLQILLIILVTWFLESVFSAIIPDSYVTPDFLLILSCSLGFLLGRKTGMWTGFVSGLLYDLMFGSVFGLTALIFMYAGYMNGRLYRLFFEDDIRIPIVSTGIFDLIYNLILFISQYMADQGTDFGLCMKTIILPEVFATILASVPMYLIYRWLTRKMQAAQLEEEQSPWLK